MGIAVLRACPIFCVIATLLNVTVQSVTELNNKSTHCQPPVLNRHAPFFRRRLYREVYHFAYRVIRREHFAFLDSLPDHAIERFYRISCVDCLADIGRITKEGIEIFPVGPPAFADLGIFVVPGVCERI